MADEAKINQTEGAVHPKEFMDQMDGEVKSGHSVPLYFDNGVDERKLIGTATIGEDGEVLMQVEGLKNMPDVEPQRPEIWMEPDIEELWAKRRTY